MEMGGGFKTTEHSPGCAVSWAWAARCHRVNIVENCLSSCENSPYPPPLKTSLPEVSFLKGEFEHRVCGQGHDELLPATELWVRF